MRFCEKAQREILLLPVWGGCQKSWLSTSLPSFFFYLSHWASFATPVYPSFPLMWMPAMGLGSTTARTASASQLLLGVPCEVSPWGSWLRAWSPASDTILKAMEPLGVGAWLHEVDHRSLGTGLGKLYPPLSASWSNRIWTVSTLIPSTVIDRNPLKLWAQFILPP